MSIFTAITIEQKELDSFFFLFFCLLFLLTLQIKIYIEFLWGFWYTVVIYDTIKDMHSDFMTVQQDASMDYPFKIGYNNMQGWISYVNGNTVLSKRYVHDAKAVYPDNDASSQVYCSKDFLELTVQSPLYRIEPEDTVKHVENFSLFHTTITEKPNNNEAYQTFLETLA